MLVGAEAPYLVVLRPSFSQGVGFLLYECLPYATVHDISLSWGKGGAGLAGNGTSGCRFVDIEMGLSLVLSLSLSSATNNTEQQDEDEDRTALSRHS